MFLTPAAFSTARDGGHRLGARKPLLLGIMAIRAQFSQPLNLGIVYKSRAIKQVADVILAVAGTRIEGASAA